MIRTIAVVTTAIVFGLTLHLWRIFDPAAISSDSVMSSYDARTLVDLPWIDSYNIHYRFGVDGLSVMLIVLTGFLSLLACFTAFSINKMVKGFLRSLHAAGDRHDGRLHGARFLPLLRLLGTDAAADVFPDRYLGRLRAKSMPPSSSSSTPCWARS